MKGDFMLQEKKNEKEEIIKIISEIDEILGTKTPSIISICIHSASLLLIISISFARYAKFADKIDGAIIGFIIAVVFNFINTKIHDCF